VEREAAYLTLGVPGLFLKEGKKSSQLFLSMLVKAFMEIFQSFQANTCSAFKSQLVMSTDKGIQQSCGG
jgi:hypothetical protein